MSVETINSELKRVLHIVERWNDDSIRSIEKAVVLSKLQDLYDMILFADEESDEVEDIVVETSAAEEFSVIESEVEAVATEAGSSADAESDFDISVEFTPEEPVNDIVKEPIYEQPIYEPIQESMPEPVQDQPVYEESAPVYSSAVKSKISKDIIMSLYGDDSATHHVNTPLVHESIKVVDRVVEESVQEEIVQEVVEKPSRQEPVSEILRRGDVYEIRRTEPKSAPIEPTFQFAEPAAGDAEPKTTLSDVYAMQDRNTVADTLGRSMNTTDLATKIVNNSSLDLKRSVGINDKFLLIRDVFDNNAQEYERVMSQFDQLSDLDDALIYIHDNITANPNSDGMKLLVELLTRKFA